jgi:hypothetical protein
VTVVDFHTHPMLATADLGPWLPYAARCGIDRIVLLGDVLGHGFDPSIEQVRAINDHCFGLVRRHGGLCRGFCFLNPANDPRATLDELERCRALGAAGVKMEVAAFASDARLDPVMRRLREVRLPLLHHCWNTRSMGRRSTPGCHQTDPEDIAALAARHPRVRIVAAHLKPCGLRGVWEVRAHRNVSFDTSGGQPIAGVIEEAVRLLGDRRVVFGSDASFPGGRDFAAQKACLEAARIGDRSRERILGLNALELLGEAGS